MVFPIALLLTFLAVMLGIVAGVGFYRDLALRDESRARERLGQEFRPAPRDVLRPINLFRDLKEFDLAALSPRGTDPISGEVLVPGPKTPPLSERARVMLRQAGIGVSPSRLLAGSAIAGLVLGLVVLFLAGPALGAAALIAGAGLPLGFVRFRQLSRREKFASQLPEAFELMARVLRAGHSVPQAFQTVADSCEQPIAGEFARCQEQQNLGLLPELAFKDLADRTGVLEIKIFAMAMAVQRQTGGNLSDVLERLGSLIRERVRLRGQIRTLTAEGRMQALVLLVLPPLLFLVMRFLNPQYADVLLEHRTLLAATAVSMAVGAWWIHAIIQLDA